MNNQFLEETVFAVADGYCNINLTKNLVPGVMYQVIDGKKYNLNEQLGISENASLTELVSAWAGTIPKEGLQEFFREFDRERLLERFENGETHVSFNYWTRTATFEPMLAEDHIAMFRDNQTGDVMAVNYVLDRTEQFRLKQQKKQLAEKNQKLEELLGIERQYSGLLSALRNIYEQIFTVDLSTGIYQEIHANKTFRPDGYETGLAQEAFSSAVRDFISEPHKEKMIEFLNFDTLEERLEEVTNISVEYMDILGSWHIASYIVQQKDQSGNVTKVLFTIQNIDEQKKNEFAEQRRTELRLQTISEAIHGGFKIGKNDSRFTFIKVSEQLADMLGYASVDELLEVSGGGMSGIVNHEDTVREMPKARKAVAAGEMYTMHYRVRCKDGSWKNIEDRGRLLRNEEGEDEFWSFVIDQDELTKKTEALDAAHHANEILEKTQQELKIARDEAEAANKAKSTFLFNMSHDIRTPMNAILGFSAIAEKNPDTPEQIREYLRKIETCGQGMLSILDNILEISRIESGKTVLENTAQHAGNIFDSCMVMVKPDMEKKHHTMKVSKQIQYPYIYCDATRVTEIILNILSNAIKYTADGGLIQCSLTQTTHEKEGWINQCVSITDNGIGMSEEFQEHIYESFEREHSTTSSGIQGTGLGMGIVRKLIDLMGGTITIQSKLGEGSTFSFQIPCRIASFEETQPKLAQTHIDKKKLIGKHILLAEDNELNAEIAMTLLSDEGFEVNRVENGVKCIELLEKVPAGYYALILMDIQMPVLDGYTATEKIRKLPDSEKSRIPIIAMTANAFTEDRQKALAVGMNDYVAKPIDMNKLIPTLMRYIDC